MTKVRFDGLSIGSSVSISASQGGTTRGPLSISAWKTPIGNPWSGVAQNQTLTVSVQEVAPSGRQFAPLGIEFRISVTGSVVGDTPDLANATDAKDDPIYGAYDPTFSRVNYVLHTGDTGNYRNERVGHASHRSKAFQYGQNPGHVYSSPGTYTGRSVYVYDDQGAWGVVDLPDLVVEDPDVAFPAERTIVVSSDGDFTGAPHHENPGDPGYNALNRVTTITAAAQRFHQIKGIGTAPNGGVRVTVKSGQTFNEAVPVDTDPYNPNTFSMIYTRGRALFDTFGGTDPILYSERDSGVLTDGALFTPNPNGGWHWTIQDWNFDFGYDVDAGMPSNGWENYNGRNLADIGDDRRYTAAANGLRLIFDRVEVQGCLDAVINLASDLYTDRKSGWFFNDCIFRKNNEYVVFQASNLFFLGTQVLEDYGTELGLMGRSRVGGAQRGFRGHRNVRETSNYMIYVRASFFESRGGWSGQNGGTTLYSPQPLFRHHEASGTSYRNGKRYYYCDSVFLGPFNLDLGGGSDLASPAIRGSHFVLENNMIIYDPATAIVQAVDELGGRKTVRNNQFLCLDTPKMGRTNDPGMVGKNHAKFETNGGSQNIGRFTRFMRVGDQRLTYGDPLEILHNSFVMLRPAAQVEGTYEVRTADALTYNNINMGPVEDRYNVVEGNNVNYAPQLSIGPIMDRLDVPAGVRVQDVWMKMVWELVVDFPLPASVAPGQTSGLIPYPNDWNNDPTVQADYVGTGGNHSVKVENTGRIYAQLDKSLGNGVPYALDAITVNFQAGGFTVTNRHPTDTWSGPVSIVLHRGTTSMAPDMLAAVDPTEVKLYRPVEDQPLSPGVRSTLFDFTRRLRPNAGFAIPTPETIAATNPPSNAAGALLPG